MASWDCAHSIKLLLDEFSEATGSAYVLVVTQGNEETPRVLAKASAGIPADCLGPHVFEALESAAADLFDELAHHLGIEPDEDDDDPVA